MLAPVEGEREGGRGRGREGGREGEREGRREGEREGERRGGGRCKNASHITHTTVFGVVPHDMVTCHSTLIM